ncbi:MAG: methylmalonyl Co-A mutase-associated GTPase MeaB [Bacteroidota bacterium]
MEESKDHTTPKVRQGVAQPNKLNPKLARFQRKRKPKTAEAYVKGILRGDRMLLSQAITLIESTNPQHQALATEIIEQCLPSSGNAIRLGITGTPGVGKSTFIESFGLSIIEQGEKVAVLAVDPTSQVTKGSILGDKTRMAKLSTHPQAFIRPSPAGTSLGGVARSTRETILLCEAAGYDCILVETVGVGQSEIAVHSMVDFFLLLLLPGGGDELQGIKRGIVEMADLVAVNKADGAALALAKQSKQAYRNALHLFPPKASQWVPQVVVCSALSGLGLDKIWALTQDYVQATKDSGFFDNNRRQQAKYWFQETISAQLQALFYEQPAIRAKLQSLEQAVELGQHSPFKAADLLLALFRQSFQK